MLAMLPTDELKSTGLSTAGEGDTHITGAGVRG